MALVGLANGPIPGKFEMIGSFPSYIAATAVTTATSASEPRWNTHHHSHS